MRETADELRRTGDALSRRGSEQSGKKALATKVIETLERILPMIQMHILRVGLSAKVAPGAPTWTASNGFSTEEIVRAHGQVEELRDRLVREQAVRERACALM